MVYSDIQTKVIEGISNVLIGICTKEKIPTPNLLGYYVINDSIEAIAEEIDNLSKQPHESEAQLTDKQRLIITDYKHVMDRLQEEYNTDEYFREIIQKSELLEANCFALIFEACNDLLSTEEEW